MPKINYEWLWYILVAGIGVGARAYLISGKGLIDYDTVRNWEILQELGSGNFRNLFHHASPGFFLLFAPFTFLIKNPSNFIYLNIIFSVGAVLLLIRFLRRHLVLPVPEAFLTGLTFGLSVYAVHNSRDLSIESLSLFLFMLFLDRYYVRISTHDNKALWQAAWVLAVGLTVNYKLILVLPVIGVIEGLQRDGVLTRINFFKVCIILVAPFLFFALVAVAVGQPFYRLPAAIISINNFTQPNPALRTGRFNIDFLYYLRYLIQYEWPLLVPALVLFPVLYRPQLFRKINLGLNIYQYLFVITYLYLAGMHLLLKAPRGLAIIFGLFYFIFYLVIKKLMPSRPIIILILVMAVSYQVWKLEREVYRYSYSSYPAVAAFLQAHNITQVATTVGRGLIPPAAGKNIEVKVIFSEAELPALRAMG
jgi:hypothetical protein